MTEAGDLRHRVSLYTNTYDRSSGTSIPTPVLVGTYWAAIEQGPGTETIVGNQLAAQATTVLTLRGNTPKPDVKDHYVYDSRRLNVVSVQNLKEKGVWWKVVCIEAKGG